MSPDPEEGNTEPLEIPRWTSRRLWLLIVAIVAVCLVSAFLIYFLFPNWQTRSEVGEAFGAINALFSGLALAGIIVAILFQRQELELQRKELELTRKELARSAKAQEESEKAMKDQAEIMARTARLNALNSLISSADIHPNLRQELLPHVEEYINEMRNILKQLRERAGTD